MAMAHEEIVEIFNRVKFPYSVNKLTFKVAHEALSNTRGMKDNVRKILEERKKLVAELKKLLYVKKVRIPEGDIPHTMVRTTRGIPESSAIVYFSSGFWNLLKKQLFSLYYWNSSGLLWRKILSFAIVFGVDSTTRSFSGEFCPVSL